MAGLEPAIHAPSPPPGVDGRDKPGHDVDNLNPERLA